MSNKDSGTPKTRNKGRNRIRRKRGTGGWGVRTHLRLLAVSTLVLLGALLFTIFWGLEEAKEKNRNLANDYLEANQALGQLKSQLTQEHVHLLNLQQQLLTTEEDNLPRLRKDLNETASQLISKHSSQVKTMFARYREQWAQERELIPLQALEEALNRYQAGAALYLVRLHNQDTSVAATSLETQLARLNLSGSTGMFSTLETED
ncbi:MAG: MCP four helix bundle domain-containing protein, partial [Bacteroidetes bacterium]|nr:MCP four helix bundle domain-containing protein [Bacteroidota bacterium]